VGARLACAGEREETYDAALAVCSNAEPITFASAADRGRRMTVDEIVEYALGEKH
jgi:hypothetical protein